MTTVRCLDPATDRPTPAPSALSPTSSALDPASSALDPASSALDPVLRALHPALVASWPLDEPHEPAPTLRAWRSQVLTPWYGDPVRLLVAGDDPPLGCALVPLPSHDNPHGAAAALHVAPGHRRRGTGRALWAGVLGLARGQGRRTVLCEAREGSALEGLLAAAGAQPALTDVLRHQPIAEVDPARVAALRRGAETAAAGFRLVDWTGPTPVHLRGPLGVALSSLNDAPTGDLDYDDEVWDAARVALRDAGLVAGGLRMHTVLALAGDEPAGFTDVAVSEDGTYAWQWGTGVAAAHRGHRLGMLLKTVMVQRLRAAEPALRTVATWNAEGNTHMVALNEALGYRVVDRVREWQATVA